MVGRQVLVFEHLCRGCGGCALICPENAIIERRRSIGTVYRGKAENGTGPPLQVAYAKLNLGEVQAPALIRGVKKQAAEGMPVIMDGPPGASCALVTTIMGADYVLMVAEDTPFGLHDLKKVVHAVEEVRIPCGAVVNRYEAGNSLAEKYLEDRGIPVLMRIPYDERIGSAGSDGKPFLSELPEYAEGFSACYRNIEQIAGAEGGNE
jgi:MinD superfamily P-loop ATPase